MPRTTLLRKQVTPTGTIQPLAGDVIPDGYLECDGSIVNIADYPRLYAIIGTAHGHGNNDGLTFHLPDYRGRFLRGKDGGAGRDPDAGTRTAANAGGNTGDAVGAVQDEDIISHSHVYTTPRRVNDSDRGGFPSTFSVDNQNNYNSGNTGGNETRPVNANVNYIIKAV